MASGNSWPVSQLNCTVAVYVVMVTVAGLLLALFTVAGAPQSVTLQNQNRNKSAMKIVAH